MDHLASTLIAFPRDDVTYTCEAFDKAAKQHVSRLAKLLKEQTAALTPAKGAQLLDVCLPAREPSI